MYNNVKRRTVLIANIAKHKRDKTDEESHWLDKTDFSLIFTCFNGINNSIVLSFFAGLSLMFTFWILSYVLLSIGFLLSESK